MIISCLYKFIYFATIFNLIVKYYKLFTTSRIIHDITNYSRHRELFIKRINFSNTIHHQKKFVLKLICLHNYVIVYTSKKDNRWGLILWRRGLSRATRTRYH